MSDEDETDAENADDQETDEEVSFDVYVVRNGEPVAGERVTADFSYAFWPGTICSEY
jgi:hypothetical protein